MESKQTLEIYRKNEIKYSDYNHVHTYKKGYKNTRKNEPKMVLRTFLVPEDIDIRIKAKNSRTGIDKVIKHIGKEIEKCKRKNMGLAPIISVESQGKYEKTIHKNNLYNVNKEFYPTGDLPCAKLEDRMLKKCISDTTINPIEDGFSEYTQNVFKINTSNSSVKNTRKMEEPHKISNIKYKHFPEPKVDFYGPENQNLSRSYLPKLKSRKNQLEIYDGYKMPLELIKEVYPELLKKKDVEKPTKNTKSVQDVCVNTDFVNNFVYNFKADSVDKDNPKNKKTCSVQHLPKLNITPNLLAQVNPNVNIFPKKDKKDKNENESKHSYSDYKSHKSLERRLSRIEKMFKVNSNTKDAFRNNDKSTEPE